MTKSDPPRRTGVQNVPIGDIVSLILNGPPDAMAGASSDDTNSQYSRSAQSPKSKRQITQATTEELQEIRELAAEVGELVDELGALVGSLAEQLKNKKDELKQRMLNHGLGEVKVRDRPAIKLTVDQKKDTTKKAIIGVLGAKEGADLWVKLPTRETDSLSVPPRSAGDGPSE